MNKAPELKAPQFKRRCVYEVVTPLRLLSLPLAAMLAIGASSAKAAPAPVSKQVPITITATLTKDKFKADEPINLMVVLSNVSDKPFPLRARVDAASGFEVLVNRVTPPAVKRPEPHVLPPEVATPVSPTRFGINAFTRVSPGLSFGGISARNIPPKGTLRVVFPVDRLFDLSEGGRFRINVSRTFELESERVPPLEEAPAANYSFRCEVEIKFAPQVYFSVDAPSIASEMTPVTEGEFAF